tara:strand:+ start:291 stop:467 length:177 start_codon:yes stop_codon:yes gene_type:complete
MFLLAHKISYVNMVLVKQHIWELKNEGIKYNRSFNYHTNYNSIDSHIACNNMLGSLSN